MKLYLQTVSLVAFAAILSPTLFAQPPGKRGGPPEGGGPGQAVLQALDIDHNHEISASEIANASAALLKLDANGDGKLSDEDQGGGSGRRGGQTGRGHGRPTGGALQGGLAGGNQGGPTAEQFVARAMEFDANNDNQLDATELAAFAEQMGPPPHGPGHGNDDDRRPSRPPR